jgi:hypothetical protein
MGGATLAITACAAVAIMAADRASAGGFGGGHSGGFGFVRGHFVCASGCGAWAHRRLHRRPPDSFAIAGDGSTYGFDDVGYGVHLYDSGGIGMSFSRAPASSGLTSGPSCHLETQTYVVPSEAGGESKVAITRCVTVAAPPSGEQGRRSDAQYP